MKKSSLRFLFPMFFLIAVLLWTASASAAAPKAISLRTFRLTILQDTDIPGLFPNPQEKPVLVLQPNSTTELKINTEPQGAYAGFSISTSDPDVVSIKGHNIKAVNRGVCTLTLTSDADQSITFEIMTAVVNPEKAIILHKPQDAFAIGKSYAFEACCENDDADCQGLYWVSEDESVFTVSQEGVVTCVGPGYTILRVYALDGSGASDKCHIRSIIFPESITITNGQHKMIPGTSRRLRTTILPNRAIDAELVWSSTNPEVVSVNKEGFITAHTYGNATITCSAAVDENISDSFQVQVIRAVEGISTAYATVTLLPGEAYDPHWTVSPTDATNTALHFTSSSVNVATVDENGIVTAVGSGTTHIIATSSDMGLAQTELTVRVSERYGIPLLIGQPATGTQPEVETFIYGQSELQRPLYATRIGPEGAARSLLMVFAIHGYEDDFPKDGQVLINIAHNIIQTMAEAEAFPEDFCLYIVPCANPDGLIGGMATQGFGRCNANNLNINRDFPINHQYNTDARDRSAKEPFATAQARALRDLVQRISPTWGVDVHGYITTVYEDGPVSHIFASTLQLPVTEAERNGGMFHIWLKTQCEEGILVELPHIQKEEATRYASKYAERFCDAIYRIAEEGK